VRFVLFAQHKKHSVEQVKKFRHPIPPANVELVHCFLAAIVRVGILPIHKTHTPLTVVQYERDKVRIEEYHCKIVHKHERFKMKRFAILHQTWTKRESKVQIGRHYGEHRIGGGIREQKVRCTWVLGVDPVLPEGISYIFEDKIHYIQSTFNRLDPNEN